MKNLKRTAWVGYDRKENGFLKGKTYRSYTDDFAKARLYARKCDVISSGGKRSFEDGELVPIPIEMNLEEEIAIIIRLGGIPNVDD